MDPAALFTMRRPRGRTERAVDKAVGRLLADGDLDPVLHAPVAAILRVLAHQLDVTDREEQSYTAATVAKTLADLLARVGGLPAPADHAGTDAVLRELLGDDSPV